MEVERLARCARETTAALVAHLAEFEARGLYRGAGYPSLFAYCTERLRISEYGAYNRELLESASGRSKREVEELIARCSPRPEVASLVRRLPRRSETAGSAMATPESESPTSDIPPPGEAVSPVGATGASKSGQEPSQRGEVLQTVPAAGTWAPNPPARLQRPAVTPLAAERYQIRFTATAETHQKLRQAQELLGHSVPGGDVAAVFDRALSALLAELTRKKFAATERPKAARAPSATSEGSRHVPADVRRRVWRRDEGRCAFIAASGLRCSARKPLEFHHVHPYGAGGGATVGNIELRCRSHNAYEAELFYGMTRNHGGMQPMTASSNDVAQLAPGRVPRGRQTRPGSQRADGMS